MLIEYVFIPKPTEYDELIPDENISNDEYVVEVDGVFYWFSSIVAMSFVPVGNATYIEQYIDSGKLTEIINLEWLAKNKRGAVVVLEVDETEMLFVVQGILEEKDGLPVISPFGV